jgi:hypothetical protein
MLDIRAVFGIPLSSGEKRPSTGLCRDLSRGAEGSRLSQRDNRGFPTKFIARRAWPDGTECRTLQANRPDRRSGP